MYKQYISHLHLHKSAVIERELIIHQSHTWSRSCVEPMQAVLYWLQLQFNNEYGRVRQDMYKSYYFAIYRQLKHT